MTRTGLRAESNNGTREDHVVLISHPVHQHGYETAVAAQNAGLLRCFVTGIYYTNRGFTGARILSKLPAGLRTKVESELQRRWHPELDRNGVYTIARYHILATALRRTRAKARFVRWLELDTWAHRRFDEAVGRFLHRSRGIRIVHAFEGSSLATFRSAKRLGITTVLDVTSTYENYLRAAGQSPSERELARARAERELADFIFAPSDYAIECLVEHGVATEKILKIPYGVDPLRFSPPRTSREDRDVFRAVYVGSIGLRKGVRHLLEAWRTLRLPKAQLVLVGQPDEDGRRILREFEGCYHWAGEVPKYAIDQWFQESDALVFPSLADSWGLAVTEAMACGLPVITTSTVGAPVRNGVDGFVVSPGDVAELRDRVRFLYENPLARREMGRRARQRVAAEYTWEHYRARVAAAYRSILRVDPPAGREHVAMGCATR